MPKGLYFTAVVLISFLLLSSFFRRLIFDVTERISTKFGHIIYDYYLKNFVRTPQAFLPTGWGQKRFLEPTLNFDLHRTWSTIGKKLVNLHGLPYMPPKCGELWYRNGWERLATFCPPPKFSHWETLPALPYGRYMTDSRQTLARVM